MNITSLSFTQKTLAADVDGTLIENRADASLSNRVKRSIQDMREKNLQLSLMTGRPLFQAIQLFSGLSLSGPSVLHCGGIIADVNTGEIIRSHQLDQESIAIVTEKMRPYKATHDIEAISAFEYAPLFQSAVKNPIEIYLAGLDSDIADSLIEELSLIQTVAVHKLISYSAGKIDLSIANSLARKDFALVELATILGISPGEIIGIGDGYNDLTWLQLCGFKIAMGNAIKDLQKVVDYIAPSVQDDGVAHVIERFLLS